MKLRLKLQFSCSKGRVSGRIQSFRQEAFWQTETSQAERSAAPVKLAPLLPGTRTDAAGKAVNNVILLSLPDEEYNLLRPHLEPVELPQYDILHEPGEKIDFAYFLNQGMTSLVALSSDGRSVEVGIAGKEGMVGMPPLTVRLLRAPFRAIMQMSGSGSRIRSDSSDRRQRCLV